MTERVLFGPGGATETKQDDQIVVLEEIRDRQMTVQVALTTAAHNLQAAAYNGVATFTDDSMLGTLSLRFTTTAVRSVTVTRSDGRVLFSDSSSNELVLELDFEGDPIDAGQTVTVHVGQTTSPCALSLDFTAEVGGGWVLGGGTSVVNQGLAGGSPWPVSISGTPAVASASMFPVRSWSQFYTIRGQRYIATTGYIQQTLNVAGELIAVFQNPAGSNTVVMFDKAEFGSTNDCRFSRFGGGTATLIGTPTARPIGRSDGGSGATSVAKIYTAGNSAPQFSISAAGTLRKVAGMSAYRAYQLSDIAGTVVLQPGQQAYWSLDETPGGGAGNFFSYVDFEWIEMPLATWNSMVTALQAKAEY